MIDDGCDFFHSCQQYHFLWDSTAFVPPVPLMYCHCVSITFVLLQFLYCLIPFCNHNNFARYRSLTENSLS